MKKAVSQEYQFIRPVQFSIFRDVVTMQLMSDEYRNLRAEHTGKSQYRHITPLR